MLLEHYLYSIDFSDMGVHAVLLGDVARVDSYRKAIENVVSAGMRVADLGAGTGVLGQLAARQGATVIMVEQHHRPSTYARLLNSLLSDGSEIEIIVGRLEETVLPPCDVVIHELMGGRLLDEGLANVLKAFARNNPWLLLPRTRVIPDCMTLWCRLVLVEPAVFESRLPTWQDHDATAAANGARPVPGSLVWATSASDVSPASDWYHLADFCVREVHSWPDCSRVDNIALTADANAMLWGFTARMAEGIMLDQRLGVAKPTCWGGTVEVLPEGATLSAGRYTLEARWGGRKSEPIGGCEPWIQYLRRM